jgi:hypothetical protein
LIAVVVALGVAWQGPKFMANARQLRQTRFSLKELLITMTVVAVVLGLAVWATR